MKKMTHNLGVLNIKQEIQDMVTGTSRRLSSSGCQVKENSYGFINSNVSSKSKQSRVCSVVSPCSTNARICSVNSSGDSSNSSTAKTFNAKNRIANKSSIDTDGSDSHSISKKTSCLISTQRRLSRSGTIDYHSNDNYHCSPLTNDSIVHSYSNGVISEICTESNSSIRDELRRLCLVCGDVASGFHYGVASCEACKAFFKRTIQGNIEYTCPANNECEINKRRRKACQACRFQKCLLMGMLKEGVRLDRVRGGRQKYRRNPLSNSYQTMQILYESTMSSLADITILDALSNYEPDIITVQTQLQRQSDVQQQELRYQNNSLTIFFNEGELNYASNSSNTDFTINNSKSCSFTDTITECTSDSTPPSTPTALSACNDNNITLFTKSTLTVHSSTTPITNNNKDTPDMLCILSNLYDKELVYLIGWAKQVPGFTDLPLNDQMKLLQVSWAEVLTLQLIFRSLPFNGKLCFATDLWMDELLAKECGFSEFYYHCVQVAHRLERISPRREEYYLLKALIMTNCDILLDEQSSLRSFRDAILNALNDVVYLLRHSSAISHQQQLLLVLPSLRQADEILKRFWRGVQSNGSTTLKKLFTEMLDPTTPR